MFCVCTAFLSKSYEIPVRARTHTYTYTQYMHSFFHTYILHFIHFLSFLFSLSCNFFSFIFSLVSHVIFMTKYIICISSPSVFVEIKGFCTLATRSSRLNAIFILVFFNFLLIVLFRLAMFFSSLQAFNRSVSYAQCIIVILHYGYSCIFSFPSRTFH